MGLLAALPLVVVANRSRKVQAVVTAAYVPICTYSMVSLSQPAY
jgi:hypothetical protein